VKFSKEPFQLAFSVLPTEGQLSRAGGLSMPKSYCSSGIRMKTIRFQALSPVSSLSPFSGLANTGSRRQRLRRCWHANRFAELRDNNEGVPFTRRCA